MSPLPFRRVAPVLDAVCLVVFVAIGREQHDLNSTGVSWFLTVLWPLAVGWVVGALVTRVYTRGDRWWLRLLGTVAVAALLDALAARHVHGPRLPLGVHDRALPLHLPHHVRVAPRVVRCGPVAPPGSRAVKP